MNVGVYQPGDSRVHRMSPGFKLVALTVTAIALSLAGNIVVLMALGALVLSAWALAGLTARHLGQNLKPLMWILLALCVFQWLATGILAAFDTLLTVTILVIAAALVSHTTRTDDMLGTLTMALSPFARFGLPPETAAFALVFVVRLVPFVSAVGHDAIAARLARGAGGNPLPALVPTVIRLMRETDALSEALVARGFGRT
jgi:biotin transport system permease protein